MKGKCISITVHTVNIQGHQSRTVKFLGPRAWFKGEIFVSNNIPYQRVLDWEFNTQNILTLCKMSVNLSFQGRTDIHTGANDIQNVEKCKSWRGKEHRDL